MLPKDEMIISQYKKSRDTFEKLGTVVNGILKDIAEKENIVPMALEYRVKTEESLTGKLCLKGEKYRSLDDITDILGARVVCFFSDEVHKFSKQIEDIFVIDRENSIDKSTLLKEDSFGYLSVHYVCSLPQGSVWPPELCGKRFEIQLRTGLQHIWAAISHDTAYKSEFAVPREIRRSLSRLAGLLELADDEFIRVRDGMNEYTEATRGKIIDNKADDIQINLISLNEYVQLNRQMQSFLSEIASIEGSETVSISAESYLVSLRWFGMETLGDVQDMLASCKDTALALAREALEGSEIDILVSTVGLYYLCRAKLVTGGFTQQQAAQFFIASGTDEKRAARQAKHLFETYEKTK
jgi:putative GTP pyrophosphokinase